MQSQLHNAFGEVTSDVGEGARTGYIGREHDVESDLGFYGVRLYEPEYGRFMSTDPLWGMYITLQPYQYAGNNPVGALDRGGDSIIVLQDWDGAMGAGHMTVLIGSDKEGWHLYSKNGGASGFVGTSEDPQDGKQYKTIDEFKQNSDNDVKQGRYDAAFMIPSTPEQDKKAKAAASKEVNSAYILVGASCADVESVALKAAGKNPGTHTTYNGKTGDAVKGGPHALPNVRIHDITRNNDATDVSGRVISSKRKKQETKGEDE